MEDNPFERLIMKLLDKEDTFEQALTVEHVEDSLIIKHVTALDERYLLNLELPSEIPRQLRTLVQISGSFKEGQAANLINNKIGKALAMLSSVNRQRRNFRLLREW